VLVHAAGSIGGTMSVPSIRAVNIARELAREADVVLVHAGEDDAVEIPGVKVSGRTAAELDVAGVDVVIAQALPFDVMRTLAAAPARVVYDFYVPVVVERIAMPETADTEAGRALADWAVARQHYAAATGDAFLCPGSRQRDFWTGVLVEEDRIDDRTYAADPSLERVVAVVPFGLPSSPPEPGPAVLKGVVPGIGAGDRVLLWAGGIWNWLDPETPIRAAARLAERRDDVKLYFLGLRPVGEGPTQAAARAVAVAEELGVRDRVVFFNEGWVDYELRQRFLLEADVGVSAHFRTLETRFAFRTRLLDHFWAGLPTVTTAGDELAELVERRGLGRVVAPGDVEGWVGALEQLLADAAEREAIGRRLVAVREELSWPRVVGPLRRLVEADLALPRASGTWRVVLEELRARGGR
jgi:glycosyltransferase involved in cell wall biosynthesis